MASVTAFLLSVLIGPFLIRKLKKIGTAHSHQRAGFEKIEKRTQDKKFVPTMGGLLILFSIVTSVMLWGEWPNPYLMTVVFTTLWMGLIGYIDDLLKLYNGNSAGLKAGVKFAAQVVCGLCAGAFLYSLAPEWQEVSIPFLKERFIVMGPMYIVFSSVVLVGSSNAVNLTDGLDGLAIGCTTFLTMTYAILSYVVGHAIFAQYLYLPFINGAGELTVFCAAMMGASLGFLWFNGHPASVFMGDTGSLSLGGAIGAIALCTKNELLLLIVGGVFVMEAVSVILQVASFKLTGKRIFKMAPIHHHFQLMGWKESKIVVRFWILAIIFALAGLASLKLR